MKNCLDSGWIRQVLVAIHKTRRLWLSTACAGLLMGAFFALLFDPLAHPVQASMSQIAAESSIIVFASAKYTVSEDVSTGKIVLRIDPPSSTPITVTVSSASIQAEAGKDFLGLRDKLVISPGVPAYTLSLTILDDQLVEGEEQLRLTLGELTGASLGVISETVVSIVDNDIAYLSIGDVVVDEEAEIVTLLITQSITSTLESVVDVRTIEGSATTPEDYAELFTTAHIPPGSTQTVLTVQLQGDDEVEGTENFSVRLEDATNSQIGNMTATVMIQDDDFFPEIVLESAEANEMDGQLSFVALLSVPSMHTVTVEYATVDGTAVAPDDYLAKAGILIFPPGSAMATVDITLLRDKVAEPEETFYLRLSNPVQGTLRSSEVAGTIRDGFKESMFLPGLGR